jgi:hypothetical protein
MYKENVYISDLQYFYVLQLPGKRKTPLKFYFIDITVSLGM